MDRIAPRGRSRAVSLALVTLLTSCGGGGGAGGDAAAPPAGPPPATPSTFTVELARVEATADTDGTALDVSGLPIRGARATLD